MNYTRHRLADIHLVGIVEGIRRGCIRYGKPETPCNLVYVNTCLKQPEFLRREVRGQLSKILRLLSFLFVYVAENLRAKKMLFHRGPWLVRPKSAVPIASYLRCNMTYRGQFVSALTCGPTFPPSCDSLRLNFKVGFDGANAAQLICFGRGVAQGKMRDVLKRQLDEQMNIR